MARPTKLTAEVQERICSCIRAGNYIETAAAYAGIHKDTLYDWLKRGAKARSGIYREFSAAVEKALADSEVRDVSIIARAADTEWQAAAWRLERKFPARWGRKTSVEHTGKDGGPIDTTVKIIIGDEPLDDDTTPDQPE
jgi:transposase